MPSIRQRVIISAALVLGALVLLAGRGPLGPPDGSRGLTLLEARCGTPCALVLLTAACVPAVLLAFVAAGAGSLLAGPFVLGAALTILAAAAGPIDDYLRASPMPAGYLRLAAESLVWLAGWVVFLVVLARAAPWLRARLPKLWLSDPWEPLDLAVKTWQAWAGGALCAAVATAVGLILIRSSDVGQVLTCLFIAFGLGGLAARMAMGRLSPAVVLLSPALVAIGAYLYLAVSYGGWFEVLSSWYQDRLPGVGLALPLHYFSAGVAGAALGIGWGQMLSAPRPAAAH